MTPPDLAAAQTLPGCADANELLTQLEVMNKRQPHKARALYFQWKATTEIMARLTENGGTEEVGYEGKDDPHAGLTAGGLADTYTEVTT